MRLYLSSFRIGDHPEHLLALLEDSPRAAIIANAMDAYERRGLDVELAALDQLGIEAEEVDLRDYFQKSDKLAEDLARFDLIWIRGGNVFVLRTALAMSGADKAIVDLLQHDAIVYGGYSAGPCVLGPSLRGLELCDDPADVKRAYGENAIFDGLGILDYAFVPHVDSPDHPESEALGLVAERYRRDGVPYRAFRDGQALVVHGGDTRVV